MMNYAFIRTTGTTLAIGALALLTTAAAPVRADETTQRQIAELQLARQHLEQEARATKPAAGVAMEREADRIQRIIDALERGEHVDPSAVKAATGRFK